MASKFTANQLDEIRELLKEEILAQLRENLKVRCDAKSYNDYYSKGTEVKISVSFEDEELCSDSFTIYENS